MRGAGESIVPLITTIVSVLLGRVLLCYLLDYYLGQQYMFGCFIGGWSIGAAIAIIYYLSGRWKRHGSVEAEITEEIRQGE